jgi:hypothetical protein
LDSFEELRERVKNLQPGNPMEESLIGRLAHNVDFIERIRRARLASLEIYIHEEPQRELIEAFGLGKRLLANRRPYDRNVAVTGVLAECLPVPGTDPNDEMNQPRGIVRRLESMAAGCRWLFERWEEIRECFVGFRGWLPEDNFIIIRLLGKKSLDAVDDREVAGILIASHAFDHSRENAFVLLKAELGYKKTRDFMRSLDKHATSEGTPRDAEQGRAAILAIVDGAMRRLREREQENEKHARSNEARAALAVAFAATPDAKSLDRHELERIRMLRRGLSSLVKVQFMLREETKSSEVNTAEPVVRQVRGRVPVTIKGGEGNERRSD